jgi:dihydrodipicolinate reductase
MFAGTGERIEISHKSHPAAPPTRRAACVPRASWPASRAGLFDMFDVLGCE